VVHYEQRCAVLGREMALIPTKITAVYFTWFDRTAHYINVA
jgi:hypothetical protein